MNIDRTAMIVILTLAIGGTVPIGANGEEKKNDAPKVPPRPALRYPLVDYDPAPLPEVRLSPRPRIWFNAADLPTLRQRCQTSLQGILARQRRDAEGAKPPGKSANLAFDLAFLYQMMGDAQYARRAIALAREVKPFAWYDWHPTGYPMGNAYFGMSEPLACVYDWCYDQMGQSDRQAIGSVIRQQLSHGPYRTKFHEPWHMCIWFSQILALYGAGIDDALAEQHLAAYNRSIHQFAAIADSIHADGAVGDYGYQYMYFMLWPEMWLRATGENLFQTCSFYRSQPEYLLYTLLTEGRWLPSDGDHGYEGFGAVSTFHFYGWRNHNPYARCFAAQVRKNWKAWPNSLSGLCYPWMQILWQGDGGEERRLDELPKVKLFPSNQVAILRSGWDLRPNSTDTLAAVYCRPFEGHCHRDAGHFVICRGADQLAQDGGFYASTNNPYHNNFFTATVAHNCVLIHDPQEPLLEGTGFVTVTANDGGQVSGDASHYGPLGGFRYRGEIRNFADAPRFSYLLADVTPAYSACKAVRVARGFFWLKPSTYVICDWVRSVKPDLVKRWLLNTPTQPSLKGTEQVVAGGSAAGIIESSNAQRATITSGQSKLFLQVLAPERPRMRRIGGRGYSAWVDGANVEPPSPKGSQDTEQPGSPRMKASASWRLEIEPTEPSEEVVFLNVLDAAGADAAPPFPAILVRRGQAIGARLKRGGGSREVLFHPDGRATFEGRTIGKALPPLEPAPVRDRE